MPPSLSPVSVTGLGLISPLGNQVESAWQALLQGHTGIAPLIMDGAPAVPAARCDFTPGDWLSKLQLVGTERVSQMAYAAACEAVKDAGLAPFGQSTRVGIYLGTGMGGAATLDAGYAALHANTRIPPLTVPTGMVSAAAGIVAMHLEIGGPVLTYSVACASAAAAIAEAAHALRRGDIDVALAGGVEAPLARGTLHAWNALQVLAKPQGDAALSSLPFDARRNGLVLGEGACLMVLERAEDAASRGRRVYAQLAGGAVQCDARHLTKPHVEGQVSVMTAALRSAGLRPADVGYCNAHGTATPVGDPVECEALRRVWEDDVHDLHLSSTKAAHGHLLGASGALEAAWTVLALRDRMVPPTATLHDVDPQCLGPDHVLGKGREVPSLRHAISNSFAFGGTNVTLVFSTAH